MKIESERSEIEKSHPVKVHVSYSPFGSGIPVKSALVNAFSKFISTMIAL